MSRINVCVIGPEDESLDACLVLQQAGFDVHTAKHACARLSQVKTADVVLRLGSNEIGMCYDGQFESFARELKKPVYYGLENLLRELDSTPVSSSRSVKTEHKAKSKRKH